MTTRIASRLLATFGLITALYACIFAPLSVQAVTYVSQASGTYGVGATWLPVGVPGLNDEITIQDNHNITVSTANQQFGGAGATAVSSWTNSSNTLRVDNFTLTHNDGPFAFEIRPNTAGANLYRIRGTNGNFVNNGTIINYSRFNSSDDLRLNDSTFTLTNNGIWEFRDSNTFNGTFRSLGWLVETNGVDIVVDSTGAGTGSAGGNFRINMAGGTGRTASIGFRQSQTSDSFTYTGDGGEVPFDIVAGNFLFGLPGRGDQFTYNGSNFSGATAPLHTTFDRTVFDDLFGSGNTAGPSTAIPTGSKVGVGGAFDTIDLISTPTGVMPTNAREHNYQGRIGIGDTAWQDVGNMMPRTTGGTLTITATTDADWYNGGFNTRGGLIENNGTLTAANGVAFGRDTTPLYYIGQSSGSNGEFRNTATGIVRIEVGTLALRDNTNTFNNQVGGLVQIGAAGSNSGAFDVRDGTTNFTNSGTFELLGNNARLGLFDGGVGGFTQEAGGTFNVNPGGGNRAFLQSNNTAKFFNNDSGTTAFNLQSGTFNFGPNQYQIAGVVQPSLTSANTLINSEFNVTPGTTLEVGSGTWTLIDPDPSGPLPVGLTLVGNIAGQGARSPSGGTMTYGDGTNDLTYTWTAGSMAAVGASGEIINNTVISHTGSGRINGGGTFTNNGTLNILNGSSVMHTDTTGTTIDNFGLIEITDADAAIRWNANNTRLDNKVGGILRANTPADGNTLSFQTNSTRTGVTFNNEGTIEVLRGIMNVDDAVGASVFTFTGISATSLDTGIYRVISSGTDRAQLDMQVNGTDKGDASEGNYDGSIVTIGANAGLVLSSEEALGASAGAQFPQLGLIGTIDGSMHVHGVVDFDLAAATTVSGTLGGDGTYNSTTITFTGSSLDPSALDGTGGTLEINANLVLDSETILDFYLDTPGEGGPNDLVNVDGNLTLDGVLTVEGPKTPGTYRLFNYTGSLNDLGLTFGPGVFGSLDLSTLGQVNINLSAHPIPEPSTALLLGLGMFGLVRRVRRRRK